VSAADVMRLMRLVGRLVKANVMMTLEYRASFFIMMVNAVAQPALGLLVWLAVSEASAESGGLPMDRPALATYFLLMGMASMATGTWMAQYLGPDIRTGRLSRDLLRPAPVMASWIANNAGEKLIKSVLMLPLVVVLALAFRDTLRLPTDPMRWLTFGAALLLAATLAFLINYVLGLLAFWLQNVDGVVAIEGLLEKLLGGRFIPLALFPAELGSLLFVLPWRYTLSFPLEVISGVLGPWQVAAGFAVQVAWCAGLWLIYRLVWRAGLRAYAASGA
jgi:ABC-2 type transport system permease protein